MRPTPAQLRELLTEHIFGVDRDPDACSVTELSLLLTLLDYVEQPDLEETSGQKRFKLPALRDTNVICSDCSTKDHQNLPSFENAHWMSSSETRRGSR